MRLMLVGGGVMFALVVAGVLVSTNRGEVAAAPPRVREKVAAPTASPGAGRSAASLAVEAEPLARRFFDARKVEDLLPLVRNPSVTEARMRGFYPGGRIEAPGLAKFNPGGDFTVRGKLAAITVVTGSGEEKPLAFVETPLGLRIDWESWVGWSELSWEKFLSSKPVTGQVFRVKLSAVDYYNFEFADESKWRSYRLESADREHSVCGYVPRGSELERRIRPDVDGKGVPLMLELKFPAGATSNNQVEIVRFVAEGWVEEGDPP